MVHLSRFLMDFPLPVPACRRGWGKRKWEVAVSAPRPISPEQRSASREAVSVGGFDDKAGSDHGGEAPVESGGADAAGCARFGERPRLHARGEGRGDAVV